MRDGWQQVTLGEVTRQSIEPVDLEPESYYSNLGVKWYAQGTFLREPKLGQQIKASKLFKVRPGQFVYNRLFATEGSFALVRDEDAEAVASNEFPVFDVNPDVLAAAYLALIFQQRHVWAQVSEQCVGTTKSRLRWKESMFAAFPVWLPPLVEQRRIVDLIAALDDTIGAANESLSAADRAVDIARDSLLWSTADRTDLASLCAVDGSLVDPSGGMAELPHVGTDRIQSGTGELRGVQSALADGVTSGKYRFNEKHVIYSKIRPNLRKVALPDFEGLCSADAYPLLPATGIPRRYLQQLLLTNQFTEIAVSRSGRTKMPKINRRELMSIQVPDNNPSTMQQWADMFEELAGTRAAIWSQAQALTDLRSNLLSALLSGEHEIPASYDDVIDTHLEAA